MTRVLVTVPCLAAALWWAPAAARETPESAAAAPPAWEEPLPITVPVDVEGGRSDLRLEVVVHRWSDGGSQDRDGQRFVLSVAEQPSFVENLRWEGGPEVELAPGEHSRTVTLVFDTAAEGATGLPEEDARLVLRVEARHEAVTPPERELAVPFHFTRALAPGEAEVAVCALRDDAPEELPIEQAFEHCDPARVPVLRSDRVVVFFTPARDLREPIGEDQFFNWRILGPNGDRVASGELWNRGSAEAPDLTMAFAAEGSPGRFAVPLRLWDANDDPDPTKARRGPGTYTVQTVDVRIEGSAVLGQGEATPFVDGEWRDEGTFEIGAVRLGFAGFVAEEVDGLPLPDGAYPGSLTVDEPQVSGSSVTIGMQARWRTRPDRPEQRAASRLTVDFPPEIRPDSRDVGVLQTRLEVLEASDDSFPLFFTAGLHRMVTTTRVPPDRHLVEGDAVPTLREPLQHATADCTGGQWVWTQRQGNPGYNPEPREGRCTVRLELSSDYRDAVFGAPERELAGHLHDPEAMWVIPVFYGLVDDKHPASSGREVSVRSYGYAIYAAEPYEGPGPSGRPPSGRGEAGSGGEAGTTAASGTGAGGAPGGGEGAGTGTGGSGTRTGSGAGAGVGTTSTGPVTGAVDPSEPALLDPDRQPRVANLVREWLAVAEPPENAIPGVDFRYDELGRKIGGGGDTGRVVSSHAAVDYGSGASSEAKVWSALRTELDSIDHCTLEEYVVARLEERSIEPCRGRYGAVRDLGGVPVGEAAAEVAAAGFEVELAPGSPAPTPEADGTVEHQEPGSGRPLKRGQTLILTVHSPFVAAAVEVPDLVGLAVSEAARRLESLGLAPSLRAGSPATIPARSNTVESQQPAAGTRIESGAAVTLAVHSPYVAMTRVPDVTGMGLDDATSALAAAGFGSASVSLAPGGPAPSPEMEGRVESQEPAAGLDVEAGSRITLRVHSAYADLRQVPAVAGMAVDEAMRRVAAAGLQAALAPGTPAPSQEAEGRVESQSPAGGSSVGADTIVRLTVHSPYAGAQPAPRPTAVPGPVGLPDLRCPASVPLAFQKGRSRSIPLGTRIPLLAGKSGWVATASSGHELFDCSYGLGGFSDLFLRVTLVPKGHERRVSRVTHCGEDSTNIVGTRSVQSRRAAVSVEVFGDSMNYEMGLRVAQELIQRAEPYAAACPGTETRRPTARPTPRPRPTSTPTPRPAPPACPGPAVQEVYNLWNPPPYGGLGGLICRDASGSLWVNVANNVYPVTGIRKGTQDASGCWVGTSVVTPGHTYGGTLCRK